MGIKRAAEIAVASARILRRTEAGIISRPRHAGAPNDVAADPY